MILSAAELAAIRAEVNTMLPSTCNLLTATEVSDGQGGFIATWGTATASVACRLDAQTGKKQLGGDAIQPYHTFVLTLPYGTTITTAYRVEIGSSRYSVSSVDSPKSWAASVRATVEAL